MDLENDFSTIGNLVGNCGHKEEVLAWGRILIAWNKRASVNEELAATDSQRLKPKMPSFPEFIQFMLGEQYAYRTHEEIYNYFFRHFGR